MERGELQHQQFRTMLMRDATDQLPPGLQLTPVLDDGIAGGIAARICEIERFPFDLAPRQEGWEFTTYTPEATIKLREIIAEYSQPQRLDLINRAANIYCPGEDYDIEIDQWARVSTDPETGNAWVQAWLWVPGTEGDDNE